MKRALRWIIPLLVLLLVLAGVGRMMAARKAQQAAQQPARAESLVELAPTDVVIARPRAFTQNLPVSGSLKAVTSAAVKARVAGELQNLTVREGDAVTAGQVIARIDPTEYQSRVRQAQEQADAAKAQIDIAQRQYDNNKALVEQGFISRTALDTSLANLNAATSSHKAAIAATDVARKALDDTVLRSPIAGVVATRLAQPGERVAIDARVIEVVDLSRLELEATLPAADSASVRIGQAARLVVEGFDGPVDARVARINPVAQAASRSVVVYLSVQGRAGLRQGLFAQGSLATGETTTLAVPLTAVRTDKPQPYVQLVVDDRVVHRTVATGARGVADGEPVVAISGIDDGARVLVGTVGALREGTRTRAAALKSAPPASPASSPSSAPR
jgi:RND family efflux transporter MFP subunit